MSDATIVAVVSGVITVTTMIIGFLTLWVKLRYGVDKTEQIEEKVDHNTKITRDANEVAVVNSKEISKRLNGGIDSAIEVATKPLYDILTNHVLQYETDMKELRNLIEEVRKKVK